MPFSQRDPGVQIVPDPISPSVSPESMRSCRISPGDLEKTLRNEWVDAEKLTVVPFKPPSAPAGFTVTVYNRGGF